MMSQSFKSVIRRRFVALSLVAALLASVFTANFAAYADESYSSPAESADVAADSGSAGDSIVLYIDSGASEDADEAEADVDADADEEASDEAGEDVVSEEDSAVVGDDAAEDSEEEVVEEELVAEEEYAPFVERLPLGSTPWTDPQFATRFAGITVENPAMGLTPNATEGLNAILPEGISLIAPPGDNGWNWREPTGNNRGIWHHGGGRDLRFSEDFIRGSNTIILHMHGVHDSNIVNVDRLVNEWEGAGITADQITINGGSSFIAGNYGVANARNQIAIDVSARTDSLDLRFPHGGNNGAQGNGRLQILSIDRIEGVTEIPTPTPTDATPTPTPTAPAATPTPEPEPSPDPDVLALRMDLDAVMRAPEGGGAAHDVLDELEVNEAGQTVVLPDDRLRVEVVLTGTLENGLAAIHSHINYDSLMLELYGVDISETAEAIDAFGQHDGIFEEGNNILIFESFAAELSNNSPRPVNTEFIGQLFVLEFVVLDDYQGPTQISFNPATKVSYVYGEGGSSVDGATPDFLNYIYLFVENVGAPTPPTPTAPAATPGPGETPGPGPTPTPGPAAFVVGDVNGNWTGPPEPIVDAVNFTDLLWLGQILNEVHTRTLESIPNAGAADINGNAGANPVTMEYVNFTDLLWLGQILNEAHTRTLESVQR